MIDCAHVFKLEKEIDECFSRTILNKISRRTLRSEANFGD